MDNNEKKEKYETDSIDPIHHLARTLGYVLAMFIIALLIFIFLNIFQGVIGFIGPDDKLNDFKDYVKVENVNISKNNIRNIEIELGVTNLELSVGKELMIKSNDPKLKVEQKDNVLKIKDQNRKMRRYSIYALKVELPEKIYDEIKLNLGIGNSKIENIVTKKLDGELGVGEVEFKNIEVKEKTKLSSGIGRLKLHGKLYGKSDIESGIGEVDIDLIGKLKDYKIDIDKGLGKISVNGEKVEKIGSGDNKIEVSGGIGEIKIKTEDEIN